MWNDECQRDFDEEKPVLLARYRFGVEQALARADFLQTDEVVVLQAFVIFLICLRRTDRYVSHHFSLRSFGRCILGKRYLNSTRSRAEFDVFNG